MAEVCANCGRTIGQLETAHLHHEQVVCAECIEKITRSRSAPPPAPAVPVPPIAATPVVTPARKSTGPVCQLCGAPMKKKVKSSGNCLGIAIALVIFCVGILVAIFIPVIGWVVGPIICLCALFIGGKRTKVWQCTKCRAVSARG